MGIPITGAKIAMFGQCMCLPLASSITAGPSRVVNISTVEYAFIALTYTQLYSSNGSNIKTTNNLTKHNK